MNKWYNGLSASERKAYQFKRTKIMRMKRRQMSDEERKAARAKWRDQKRKQRAAREVVLPAGANYR